MPAKEHTITVNKKFYINFVLILIELKISLLGDPSLSNPTSPDGVYSINTLGQSHLSMLSTFHMARVLRLYKIIKYENKLWVLL